MGDPRLETLRVPKVRTARDLSVIRLASASSIEAVCTRLDQERPHPKVEIRQPYRGKYSPAWQLLSKNDLKFMQGIPAIDPLFMLKQLYKRVPTIRRERTVHVAAVRHSSSESGEHYLGVIPYEGDVRDLRTERRNLRAQYQEVVAESTGLRPAVNWKETPIDITFAYIPRDLPKIVVSNTVELIESLIGSEFTLEPAVDPSQRPNTARD